MSLRVPQNTQNVTADIGTVPTPKLPTATPEMFGTGVAAAGAQAGKEVESAAAGVADKLIQQKLWSQQAELYQNKENVRVSQQDILHNNRTTMVLDPDSGQKVEIPDGLLDRTGKWAENIEPEYRQRMDAIIKQNTPDDMLNIMKKQYDRNFGSLDSLGHGQVVGYQSQQIKQNVDNSFANSLVNEVKASGDAVTPDVMLSHLSNANEITLKRGAFNGWAPAQIMENQQKTSAQIVANSVTGLVGKGGTIEDAQAMIGAAGNTISPTDADLISKNAERGVIAYQKQQEKIQEIKQQGNALKLIGDVAAGNVGQQNVKDINTMDIPDKLKSSLTAALNSGGMDMKNAPTFIKAGLEAGGITQEVTLNSLQDRMRVTSQNKQFAQHMVDLANSPTQNALVEEMSKVFQSKSDSKITQEQQNIAAQVAVMRGQFAPVNSDAADGKTIDSKAVAPTAGLLSISKFSAGKPNTTSLFKDYVGAVSSGMDPVQAHDTAVKNWVLSQYPQAAGRDVTAVIDSGTPAKRVIPMNYKPGTKVYPDFTVEKKKSSKPSASMTVPNEA